MKKIKFEKGFELYFFVFYIFSALEQCQRMKLKVGG